MILTAFIQVNGICRKFRRPPIRGTPTPCLGWNGQGVPNEGRMALDVVDLGHKIFMKENESDGCAYDYDESRWSRRGTTVARVATLVINIV